jgi:hypothetical protein
MRKRSQSLLGRWRPQIVRDWRLVTIGEKLRKSSDVPFSTNGLLTIVVWLINASMLCRFHFMSIQDVMTFPKCYPGIKSPEVRELFTNTRTAGHAGKLSPENKPMILHVLKPYSRTRLQINQTPSHKWCWQKRIFWAGNLRRLRKALCGHF